MLESLDFEQKKFADLLQRSSDMVLEQFEHYKTKKAFSGYGQKEIESWFAEKLPEDPMDLSDLMSMTNEKIIQPSTNNLGSDMYAYVMAGGTQVSIVAEQLAATVNQNIGKWHLSPTMSELEKRVILWGAEMIGYHKDAGGVLVSGGSAANLAGLTVARNLYFEKLNVRHKGLWGMAPGIVYASTEVHGCVDKSMELLGMGTNHLRKIEVDSAFKMDLSKLEDQIKRETEAGLRPFCLIGNAGTVNTGAIDDLEEMAILAKEYDLWYHIDGAYGGLAATLTSLKDWYKGMELADSVAIDFHKWLYQPFEAGCLLVKNWNILKKAYFKKADYLDNGISGDSGRLDFNEHYFQLSRNSKSLKIWMTIKAYGMKAIRSMIQKDIDLTHYLSAKIKESADLKLIASSELAIACFQYVPSDMDLENINRLNRELIAALERDGRVFIAGTKIGSRFVLRACLINHRKQKVSIDYLLKVIREVGSEVFETQFQTTG